MSEQNFKNHGRFLVSWHIVTSLMILAAIIGSFVNLSDSWNNHNNLYSASLICLITIILALFFAFIRSFPLKAQDRVIRAEENLRFFVLNGTLLDSRLRMDQIIALRFAPDAEFTALAKRAVAENLSPKEIKKAISNWKADHHRM